jgi:hypothetical protein
MTGQAPAGSDQTVDPVFLEWASLAVYWALVGLAALLAVVAVDTAIALALAPIALMIIEFVARRLAARFVG